MEIKLIEPIKNYSKEFNTPDEFNIWYSKNKNEIDSLTTHKLNKMYHIVGYRITKIKGVLCLKKWNGNKNIKTNESKNEVKVDEVIDEFREEYSEQLEELKKEIDLIKKAMNNLIAFINGNIQIATDVSPPVVT